MTTRDLARLGRHVKDTTLMADRLGVAIPPSVAIFVACDFFVNQAWAFCDYLEGVDLGLDQLRLHLIDLVAAADQLPHVEPTSADYGVPGDVDERGRVVAARIFDLADGDVFYEIPDVGGAYLVGDLGDDLEEIYRDLRRGLAIAHENHIDGTWDLRFSFDTHWREHAEEAAAALGGDRRFPTRLEEQPESP